MPVGLPASGNSGGRLSTDARLVDGSGLPYSRPQAADHVPQSTATFPFYLRGGTDNLGRQSNDTGTPCPGFKLEGTSKQVLLWKAGGGIDRHRAPGTHDSAGIGDTGDADMTCTGNRSIPSCLGHRSKETVSVVDLAMGAPLHRGEPEALPASQGADIRLSAAARHLNNK